MEYWRAVRKHWVSTVSGAVGIVLGVVKTLTDSTEVQDRRGQVVTVHKEVIPTWVWLSLFIIGFGVAQYRAWLDMRTERDVAALAGDERAALIQADLGELQTQIAERESVDLDLTLRQLEHLGKGALYRLYFQVENRGPDGSFAAMLGQVHGLPDGMPDPYGDFPLPWELASGRDLTIYHGAKAALMIGHWNSYSSSFRFSASYQQGVMDGHEFRPVGSLSFDIDVRDTGRGVGRSFHISVLFEKPESNLPPDFIITPASGV